MKTAKTTVIIMMIIAFISATVMYPAKVAALEEKAAETVFEATEPDDTGRFTITMTIYNATFNTFQFALRYDKSTVVPVDASGKETSSFSGFASKERGADWMSSIGTNLDSNTGLIEFAGYVTPGSSTATDGLKRIPGYAAIGKSGTEIYTFRFKKIAEADIKIKVAEKSDTEPYSKSLPEGAALFNAGKSVPLTVSFRLPEGIGRDYSMAPVKKTAESAMSKEERLKDSVALQIGNYGAAVEGALVHIDSANKAVVPYIDENSRTMVPVRFIAERFGAYVKWDPDLRQITITIGDKTIVMTIESAQYTINGELKAMDTAPVIKAGWNRTMVPIRFTAEALGMSVGWDSQNKLVLITPVEQPWQPDRKAEREATDSIKLIISPLLRDFAQ